MTTTRPLISRDFANDVIHHTYPQREGQIYSYNMGGVQYITCGFYRVYQGFIPCIHHIGFLNFRSNNAPVLNQLNHNEFLNYELESIRIRLSPYCNNGTIPRGAIHETQAATIRDLIRRLENGVPSSLIEMIYAVNQVWRNMSEEFAPLFTAGLWERRLSVMTGRNFRRWQRLFDNGNFNQIEIIARSLISNKTKTGNLIPSLLNLGRGNFLFILRDFRGEKKK